MPQPPIRRVKEAKAGSLIAAAERPLLVDVSTEWCPPCRMQAPYLRKFAAEHAGRLDIVEIDGDDADAFKEAWEVDSFPTLLVFAGGRLVDRIEGFHGYAPIRLAVQTVLGAPADAAESPAETAFTAAAEAADKQMEETGPPSGSPENRAIEQAFDALEAFAAEQDRMLDAGAISGEAYNARIQAEQDRVLARHKPALDAALARAKEKIAAYAAAIDAATEAFLEAQGRSSAR